MTQGELEKLAVPIQQNLSTLESRVMSDIVRRIRINGEITSTADWQINRLYQMGVSKKEIKKAIGESLGLSKAEVKKLYHDTLYNEYARNQQLYKEKGAKWISFDKNNELQDLIAAVEKQTNEELKNITQSLGFAIRGSDGKMIQSPLLEFYQGTLDDAMMDIASGAFDYGTVLNRTVQTMTNSGLRSIDYASGWSNRVDVAARRAAMTGFNQLQGKINEQVARDLKTEYFEVSWHGGARPEHQVWQGRVFTRKQLETVCGLGTITGLLGANCYHQYNAFIPGVSVRTYSDQQLDQMNPEENRTKEYNGKEYTTYEALQHQRKMETLMRKQRQDIKLLETGGASKNDILAAKSRYRSTMSQYVEFSKSMELPQQKERVYMDGLGKLSGKDIVKSSQTDIIKIKNTSNGYEGIPKSWKIIEERAERDNLSLVNPQYNPFSVTFAKEDYSRNCANCVVASEMRKRGYDVTAKPLEGNKRLAKEPWTAWKNPEIIKTSGSGLKEIRDFIEASDEGTRIQICVRWKSGDGHTFVAEKEKGELILFDPQSNASYKESIFEHVTDGETLFWRIDHLEISDRGVNACKGR